MLRGRIVQAERHAAPEDIKAPPEAQWVLQRRPRPILCADGAGRLQGGRGRVVARGLCRRAAGLLRGRDSPRSSVSKLGDTVTVNVLGRNVTARIANLREVKMGEPCHQLRHGVLAQHAGGRAAQPAGDDHAAEDGPLPTRGQVAPQLGTRLPGRHRHPRQGRDRRLQRHLRQGHDRRARRPAASRCSPAPSCWRARLPPRSAAASSRR